ncbi:hypothetical protein [Leptospira sp. mild_001]|uniref:hypothetical protein n=1 Tax=Leptospira sp. mild_001 TaxID=2838238 RepID=UPI001E39C2F5|nr:hypothetical protein [Leptospira sp. mild_001]
MNPSKEQEFNAISKLSRPDSRHFLSKKNLSIHAGIFDRKFYPFLKVAKIKPYCEFLEYYKKTILEHL